MIKLLNAKQLNPLAKNTSTNNKKQNLNTNLGGLSQDTFEFSNSKNPAFAGKPAQNIEDIAAKLEEHGLKNGLVKKRRSADEPSDKYIIIINEGLSDTQSQEQAKNLVIDIGKLYDPEKNKKLADDIDQHLIPRVIQPLLNKSGTAATGIEIIKEASTANRLFAKKNIDKLDPFIKEEAIRQNQNLATQAIKAMGAIAQEHPTVSTNSVSKLLKVMPVSQQNPPNIKLTAIDTIYKIAKDDEPIRNNIKNSNTIARSLIHICQTSQDLSLYAHNRLKMLANLYTSDNIYTPAVQDISKFVLLNLQAEQATTAGQQIADEEALFKANQQKRKKELESEISQMSSTHPDYNAIKQELADIEKQQAERGEAERRANKAKENMLKAAARRDEGSQRR